MSAASTAAWKLLTKIFTIEFSSISEKKYPSVGDLVEGNIFKRFCLNFRAGFECSYTRTSNAIPGREV